jgi:HD-GYP domain-containing protein (c-di-GMP phosphodiesterase class II)
VERGLIKMHPSVAAEILEQAPALRDVVPIVYHHHERYDGSGYVDGVAGESIPIGSRVLAVADAYVAMTSDRPYRSAKTHSEAVAELQEHAGTQFDPGVVEAFMDLQGTGAERVPDKER